MDFQCDRCGQKYHVADEKLQGRAASRFKCKKCENNILLSVPPAPAEHGLHRPASTVMRAQTSASPARPGTGLGGLTRSPSSPPRPRMPTSSGPAFSGGPGARLAPASAARVDATDPDENDWFAGIRGTPTGPLTRTELALRVTMGDVTGDTLVWRDGFGDWRALKSVPALKDLAPSLRVVQPAPAPSFVDFDGDATVVTSQGPAMVAAAMRQAGAGKHDQALQEAPTRKLSALTHEQLRDIRLPPANERSDAPSERPPPRPSVAAPAKQPTLAPAAKPSMAPAAKPSMAPLASPSKPLGSSLTAPAPRPSMAPLASPSKPLVAPLSSQSRPPTPPSAPPRAPTLASAAVSSAPSRAMPSAPPAQPRASLLTPAEAPAAPRVSQASVAALAMPTFQEATSAPVPSLADLAAATSSAREPASEVGTHRAQTEAPSATASPGWSDPLFNASIPPTALSTPAPTIDASRGGAWADPLFHSHPPPSPEVPSIVAVSLAAPPVPQMSLPPAVMNTGQVAFAVDVARPKPRGVPKGVWVLTAGLAVAGVAAGIAVTRRPSSPAVAGTVVESPGEVDRPESRPAAPPTAVPVAQVPIAQPAAPESPDMVFAPDDNSLAAREHRRRVASRAPSAAPEPTGQQRQAQLERMLGLGGGAVPPPNTNNLPSLRTPQPSPGATVQPNNAPPQGTGRILDTVRTREAEHAVERSGVVRQCWEQFKLRNPAAQPRSLNIGINVAATGQITLRIANRSDPALSACIENRSSTVRALPPGSAISSTTRADLN